MIQLALPRALAGQIADAAHRAAPGECCGLLEGIWDGECARVIALHPARNLSSDADRFEIAPQDHFAALKAVRAGGHVLIGCYHSHPAGMPQPSPADAAGAGERNFVWLIAAPGDKDWDLAAFLYTSGGFGPALLLMSSE